MQNVSKKEMRLAVISNQVGSMLEFYDFQIYGMAAALVFNVLFFPEVNPTTVLLASFATFGVWFIARPLGGMFWGGVPGRYYRPYKTLVITLIGMGIVSCLTSLLPGYIQIGLWAPSLLVLLVYEYAPPHRRGFFGVFPQIGGFLGNLLSADTLALVTCYPRMIYCRGAGASPSCPAPSCWTWGCSFAPNWMKPLHLRKCRGRN